MCMVIKCVFRNTYWNFNFCCIINTFSIISNHSCYTSLYIQLNIVYCSTEPNHSFSTYQHQNIINHKPYIKYWICTHVSYPARSYSMNFTSSNFFCILELFSYFMWRLQNKQCSFNLWANSNIGIQPCHRARSLNEDPCAQRNVSPQWKISQLSPQAVAVAYLL